MGDRLPKTPFPAELDEAKIKSAVDAAFSIPDAETTAFVVTWKGRLIGERFGDGITMTTPLESWSMGKSVTSTIMGTLIQKGVYTLDQPARIPEWQEQPNDPRAQIKIQDILRMSSGIRIISPSDPDYDPKGRTRITSTSTPTPATPSSTRRPVRSSGRPTPWAATATPIRC